MIIDASVLLRAYFPDEAQAQAQAVIREHIAGRLQLKAPALLTYEVSNAIWQAERRGRITTTQADAILVSMTGLDIEIIAQGWDDLLPLARGFNISAYDTAYLHLADQMNESLITGDLHLYKAIHTERPAVLWIEDFQVTEE